jgi:prophage regulatory protein
MSFEHSPARGGMRVYRRKELLELLGISATTLYAWIAQGRFPRPINLGANSVAWLQSEVDEYLQERARERDQLAAAADAE